MNKSKIAEKMGIGRKSSRLWNDMQDEREEGESPEPSPTLSIVY